MTRDQKTLKVIISSQPDRHLEIDTKWLSVDHSPQKTPLII
jgi:hypothetical protein